MGYAKEMPQTSGIVFDNSVVVDVPGDLFTDAWIVYFGKSPNSCYPERGNCVIGTLPAAEFCQALIGVYSLKFGGLLV